MRVKHSIKKALLFGIIGLAGYIASISNADKVGAAVEVNSKTIQAVSGQAVSTTKASSLYPIRVTNEGELRYGYIDGTGQMVIDPIYITASNYSEGYAVVYNGKKYQIINLNGEVIFESEGVIEDFHNGLAAYSDPNNNYNRGYVNTKGKVVIKPAYGFAGDFQEDKTAIVTKGGKFYSINNKGKIVKTYKLDGTKYYYDITDDGYVIYTDSKTFLKGVINLDGKVIMKPLYGDITYLGSHLFGVKKALPELEEYLISIKPSAIFNKDGKRLTDYQYYDLSKFYCEYASVTNDTSTYFIDKKGKKVTSLPELVGRGTATVLGNVIQADIESDMVYLKKDGTYIWKNDGVTQLPSGITVRTATLRPNKFVVVNYPILEGLANEKVQASINKKLYSSFTEYRKKLKVEDYLMVQDKFTVEQIEDLLIVKKTGYDYPVSAAHGMPIRFYYFINVKTGDFYQLKDLFKKDSDYTSKLSKLVEKQIKADKNGFIYYYDSNSLVSKDQWFYVSKDKLIICYDNGAIAPYAAGFPEFPIPFKSITDILNKDGAFWKAFH